MFWSRWRREYLILLHQRQKWNEVKRSLKVNDLVFVMDSQLPRNQWPLGRIVETNIDRHGLVRSVSVKVSRCRNGNLKDYSTSVIDKPVSKLTLYGPNSFFRRFSGHNLR